MKTQINLSWKSVIYSINSQRFFLYINKCNSATGATSTSTWTFQIEKQVLKSGGGDSSYEVARQWTNVFTSSIQLRYTYFLAYCSLFVFTFTLLFQEKSIFPFSLISISKSLLVFLHSFFLFVFLYLSHLELSKVSLKVISVLHSLTYLFIFLRVSDERSFSSILD